MISMSVSVTALAGVFLVAGADDAAAGTSQSTTSVRFDGDQATLSSDDGALGTTPDHAARRISLPLLIEGRPPFVALFAGSAKPAKFWIYEDAVAASSTTPEIGAQFNITSRKGAAHPQDAYKIGLFSSAYCSTGSADCYGYNGNVQGNAGKGGFGIYGAEIDVNNEGADAPPILSGLQTAYGMMILSGGHHKSTSAVRVAATSPRSNGWYAGFMSDQGVLGDSFADYSGSTHVLAAYNRHAAGIDFTNATFSGGGAAAAFGNNQPVLAKDPAGTLRNLFNLDRAGGFIIGDPGIPATTTVRVGTAFGLQLVNEHEARGDIGLVIRSGSNASSDASSSPIVFATANGRIVVGSIRRGPIGTFGVQYLETSDARLKHSVADATDSLAKVLRLHARTYTRDGASRAENGFLAQEVFGIYPDAVSPPDPGGASDPKANPWEMEYGRITPLLVGAIQDMNRDLEADNKNMQRRIYQLWAVVIAAIILAGRPLLSEGFRELKIASKVLGSQKS